MNNQQIDPLTIGIGDLHGHLPAAKAGGQLGPGARRLFRDLGRRRGLLPPLGLQQPRQRRGSRAPVAGIEMVKVRHCGINQI